MVLARSLSNATPTPLRRAIAAYHKLDLTNAPQKRIRPAPPKSARHLNAVELARLVERYQSGATVYELAEELSIDRRTVSLRLKQQGVTMRHQPSTEDMVDEMVRLYESGLSS